jgi:hypothetical protein
MFSREPNFIKIGQGIVFSHISEVADWRTFFLPVAPRIHA